MSDAPKGPSQETKRKRKQRLAGSNREKGIMGLGYSSGCPECPWQFSHVMKQNQPVSVYVLGDAKKAQCREGHVWKLQ